MKPYSETTLEIIEKELKDIKKQGKINEIFTRSEYNSKKILYYINIAAIISYIGGALMMQLPFVDKVGLIPYDFKMYLLVGAIIFIFTQLVSFCTSFYNEISFHLCFKLSDKLYNFLSRVGINFTNSDDNDLTLEWILKVFLFIPVGWKILAILEKSLCTNIDIIDKDLILSIFVFIKIYFTTNLFFKNSFFSVQNNIENFKILIISLAIAIFLGRSSIEPFLLTDAVMVNSTEQTSIQIIYIDGKSMYYKIGTSYEYKILDDNTIIQY